MQAKVTVSKDGLWAGDGYWDIEQARIVDCPAPLADDVYAAVEDDIRTAFEAAQSDG